MTKTKIIATLGPSSSSYTVIRKMVVSGLDVVRLNFSHGTYDEHLRRLKLVRKINKKYRRRIRIMQDLEGYRIRVGTFKNSKEKVLKKSASVWFVKDQDRGEPDIIPLDYKHNLDTIKKGKFVYIDDGNITLKVIGSSRESIKAKVIAGGILKEKKGINIPGLSLRFPGITDKDKKDLEFGIKYKVDYIAQSFVRSSNDIYRLKDMLKPYHPNCQIVAKIESKEAIRNIDKIIDAADVIMIARGDMGVVVPVYTIPILQKLIIKKCNQKKKFVITATQMLEHMREHNRPTRAEVTDVANAILDGTDFVMLSAETASGLYPCQSVKMMNQIIEFTEQSQKSCRSASVKFGLF